MRRVVLPAVLLALTLGGCAVSTEPTSGADTSQDENKSTRKAAAKAVKSAGVGDPVRDGKFEFTVTKTTTKTKLGNEFMEHKAQGVFLLVHVTVKNIGDEAQMFDSSGQKLFDSRGREFSADGEAAVYLGDSNSFLKDINPGNKVKGIVVFDIPKGTKPTKVELHDSLFSGGTTVRLS